MLGAALGRAYRLLYFVKSCVQVICQCFLRRQERGGLVLTDADHFASLYTGIVACTGMYTISSVALRICVTLYMSHIRS